MDRTFAALRLCGFAALRLCVKKLDGFAQSIQSACTQLKGATKATSLSLPSVTPFPALKGLRSRHRRPVQSNPPIFLKELLIFSINADRMFKNCV